MSAHAPHHHWCPACDAGWVEPVTITPIGTRGWLCGECEAFWLDAQAHAIGTTAFVQLGVWLREQGDAEEMRVVRGAP